MTKYKTIGDKTGNKDGIITMRELFVTLSGGRGTKEDEEFARSLLNKILKTMVETGLVSGDQARLAEAQWMKGKEFRKDAVHKITTLFFGAADIDGDKEITLNEPKNFDSRTGDIPIDCCSICRVGGCEGAGVGGGGFYVG